MGGRWRKRYAEQRCRAKDVFEDVDPLGRNLGGPFVAIGVEERREEDGCGLDLPAVALGQGVDLRPGEVRVGGDDVEIEDEWGAHRPRVAAQKQGALPQPALVDGRVPADVVLLIQDSVSPARHRAATGGASQCK